MDIFKIIIAGIVVVVFSAILKSYRSEFSVLLVLCSSVVFFFFAFSAIKTVFDYLMTICATYGIDSVYYEILFKTLGISYICEFASALCKDSGESAVSVKIDLAGKLTVILLTLPMFKSFIETITKIMP